MRQSGFALFFLLFCFPAAAQTTYEVSFPNPNSHYIQVEARFSNIGPDSIDIVMPVWTPGSYMVRDYARHVEGFRAVGATGTVLPARKIRKNAWRVYQGASRTVSCFYQVYAFDLSVRTCYVDVDQAYLNGAGVFMFTRELKDREHMVLFRPAGNWSKISTTLSMFREDPWARTAPNYDELIDCPVVMGNHVEFQFDYKGIWHKIAMVGQANYDMIRINKDLYKIVDECTRLFGENPVKEYLFIVHNHNAGGGGLEHANSTSIIVDRKTYDSEAGYRSFLSLAAHEYFHLWIVKRVRPLELGPFNYDREVYTRQLWFYEGFTSYYDDYILYKCGFYTAKEYLDIVVGNYQSLVNTPGANFQSVSDASFDAWIKYYRPNENSRNSTVSYYTKGALLAVMFNLDVLNFSEGVQSLNTLMHHLYNEHYKNFDYGLSDKELFELFEGLFGQQYKEFFEKYIDGTVALPFEQYMDLAGIRIMRKDGMREQPGYLGATLIPSGNKLLVTYVERDGPAVMQGLSVNDEIVSAGDKTGEAITAYLATLKPGNEVKFKILRAGRERTVAVTLGETTQKEFNWEFVQSPSEKQLKVRNLWLGEVK